MLSCPWAVDADHRSRAGRPRGRRRGARAGRRQPPPRHHGGRARPARAGRGDPRAACPDKSAEKSGTRAPRSCCSTWRCPLRARWSRSRCAIAAAGGPSRPPPAPSPGDAYRNESAARGVTPAAEPFDDSTDYRLRVVRGAGRGADGTAVRYRFTATPVFSGRPLPRPLPGGARAAARPGRGVGHDRRARWTSTSRARGPLPAAPAGRAAAPPRAADGRCRGRRAIRPRPPAPRRWTRAWRWPCCRRRRRRSPTRSAAVPDAPPAPPPASWR